MENVSVLNKTAKGVWGTSEWILDGNGVLLIKEGEGASFLSPERVPWYAHREAIKRVIVEKNVTLRPGSSLSYMFCDCSNLRDVDFTGLCTEGVIGMNRMFYMCNDLEKITFGSNFDTSSVVNMSFMFAVCSSLRSIDLSCFNTSQVTDMSGLFSSCSSLEYVGISHFDVSKVTNMLGMFMNCNALTGVDMPFVQTSSMTDSSYMFCNCTNLRDFDLSNLDTSHVTDMSSMFLYCKKLQYLDISSFHIADSCNVENMIMYCPKLRTLDMSCAAGNDKIKELTDGINGSTEGFASLRISKGAAGDEEIQKWVDNCFKGAEYEKKTTEKDTVTYYLPNTQFTVSFRNNMNEKPQDVFVLSAGDTIEAGECQYAPYDGFAFKEWNTKKNGKGKSVAVNGSLGSVVSDMNLYAVWGSAPVLGTLQRPGTINYGETLQAKPPKIIDNNWEILSKGMQISPDGVSGWKDLNEDEILPVAYNGYYIRFYATNFKGTAYSNSVRIYINKAVYDIGDIVWTKSEFVYDGTEKKIHIENLPEGAIANYKGCFAVSAGTYYASAIVTPADRNNYIPLVTEVFPWEIKKATYDMTNVRWSEQRTFEYNGKEQSVLLENLPDGVKAEYIGNTGVTAGEYTASAIFRYDENNYEPLQIEGCTWRIEKAKYDVSGVTWHGSEGFVYDGTQKTVYLKGLPAGLTAEYTNASAFDAGTYTTYIKLVTDSPENYEVPEIEPFTWEIKKARYDMSKVRWKYAEAFTYDGTEKEVVLANLPEGVLAVYSENCKTYVGRYTAAAELHSNDPANYENPVINTCEWSIKKAVYNMDDVRWDYAEPFSYDGEDKQITLINLPMGVIPHYKDNTAKVVGVYNASADFKYDEDNYEKPHTRDCQWKIKKAVYDMSQVSWIGDESFVYDGNAKKVYLENLPQGITAKYEGNTAFNAGIYTAKAFLSVEDTDNFEVPAVKNNIWGIKKAEYDMSGVQWNYFEPFVYNGQEKSVYLTGLPEGVTASYSSNMMISAGVYTATAVINGDTKNYEVPVVDECRWVIEKADINIDEVVWDYAGAFTYDGEEKYIELIGLPEGVAAYYNDNRKSNAGTYRAEAVLSVFDERNYNIPEVEDCYWEIQRAVYDTSHIKWVCEPNLTYDGKEKGVFLRGLPEGLTARYSGNKAKDAGEYMAQVVLVNDTRNYETPEIEPYVWSIKKAEKDISSIVWEYSGSFTYDGTGKKVFVSGLPTGVNAVYSGNEGVNAGEYYATVRLSVDDERNYNVGSVSGCSWEIGKAEYDMSGVRWDYEDDFVYDGSEKSIALVNLPRGVAAEYKGNKAVNAGQYTAEAVVTQYDKENFKPPVISEFDWEIKKAQHDTSSVRWEYSGAFTYDGSEKSIALISVQEEAKRFFSRKNNVIIKGLPEGVHVTYSGNAGINAGLYIASAICSIDDETNYEVPIIEDCTWEIKKASYDLKGVTWNYSKPFTYDGGMKSVELQGLPSDVKVEYSGNVEAYAGEYLAHAVLLPDDFENYEVPIVEDCQWKINKAVYDIGAVKWSDNVKIPYDGEMKSVLIENVPDGVTVKYTGNHAVNPGTYYASAILIPEDLEDYIPLVIENHRWEIVKE